ncbi:caspase domain-containing protein [Bradyrhizobium sp. YCK136]|uniref:caspase family protein n=1 Tax=Bradyrhizobium TaxID=374 RepID=UPI001B8D2726|nr:caspase family protein [Bradyrhizobium diazoefficiens]MBR0868083.1 caspase family protein [Bradyrhizobium diazoefficiens]MBR0892598.1 caspase family protein [Bradyrhizobium diazoefficiens]MBR0924293.1 caspase family protein [Bradyrhizobium diazoefficiens]
MRHLFRFAIGLIVVFLMCSAAYAEKRVALVIGNGAYKNAPRLPNPTNDASDVAAALAKSGFDVIFETNLDQLGMQEASIRFARQARSADVALFYFSGHALQFAGVNYLLPVDAVLRDEADLRRMSRADQILADLQQAKNLRILVLDACRDNPFVEELKRSIGRSRSFEIGRGLSKLESPDGTIISYATQSGRTADDGSGRNSPYTSAFLRRIVEQDNVTTIFQRIGADVYEKTRGAQVPELSLSFFGEYYLNGRGETVAPVVPSLAPADPCAHAAEHWKSAELLGIAAYEDHIARFSTCSFADLARSKIAALSKPSSTPNRFDGVWIVKEVCEKSGVWPADAYQFAGTIRDGMFHTHYGAVGQADGWTFDGKIQNDGSAEIDVKGLTGKPADDPLHRPSETAVHYKIALKLEGVRGAGIRIETPRPCRSEWTKFTSETTSAPNSTTSSPTPSGSEKSGSPGSKEKQRLQHGPTVDRRAKAEPELNPKRQAPAGSCSAVLSGCRTRCVSNGGRPDCASTTCVQLHQQCLQTGCWSGKAFNGCGFARQ